MTSPRRPPLGYTLLELLLAMAIFTFLGAMTVFLMRQGMNVFSVGTRESGLQDRQSTLLPLIVRDLENLAIPHSIDAPPAPPNEEERLRGVEYRPPPSVEVRLRAGTVVLREGPLKDLPCPYAAWVVSVAAARGDPALRQAGDVAASPATPQRPYVPAEVDKGEAGAGFRATGGLMEVAYVAVPEDPAFPAVLTLYRGFRSPVGGAESLLLPENLDTLLEIRRACRPIARGVLHFGLLWRRVFATDWNETAGTVGETDPYVGRVWDSTRALERGFPLFLGPASLGDPSDDVFPRWARVEIALLAPTAVGYGLGETELQVPLAEDARELRLADLSVLGGAGPKERHLKVGSEWMGYGIDRIDFLQGVVRVERGVRGTRRRAHEAGSQVYVGLGESRDVRLPVYLDRFARIERQGPR
jgi:hypothetical protein